MVLTTLEILLLGIVVSLIGYVAGRFDKRLTKVEKKLDGFSDPNWRSHD